MFETHFFGFLFGCARSAVSFLRDLVDLWKYIFLKRTFEMLSKNMHFYTAASPVKKVVAVWKESSFDDEILVIKMVLKLPAEKGTPKLWSATKSKWLWETLAKCTIRKSSELELYRMYHNAGLCTTQLGAIRTKHNLEKVGFKNLPRFPINQAEFWQIFDWLYLGGYLG